MRQLSRRSCIQTKRKKYHDEPTSFHSSDVRDNRTVTFHVKSLEAGNVALSWPVLIAGMKETCRRSWL